jgi:hypothetical protein
VQKLVSGGNAGPLGEEERITLEEKFRPYASRLAYYRGIT